MAVITPTAAIRSVSLGFARHHNPDTKNRRQSHQVKMKKPCVVWATQGLGRGGRIYNYTKFSTMREFFFAKN
ncbi:MAG TPA: hypothetical protein VEB64_13445 [Azospirillaceae bacterium]|nr:hypothetical protein [Azospirillaceae bacterium]